MNGKTARLIRTWARLSGAPYKVAKQAWTRMPSTARAKLREAVERSVGSVRA